LLNKGKSLRNKEFKGQTKGTRCGMWVVEAYAGDRRQESYLLPPVKSAISLVVFT
jgi:hypothetical protein